MGPEPRTRPRPVRLPYRPPIDPRGLAGSVVRQGAVRGPRGGGGAVTDRGGSPQPDVGGRQDRALRPRPAAPAPRTTNSPASSARAGRDGGRAGARARGVGPPPRTALHRHTASCRRAEPARPPPPAGCSTPSQFRRRRTRGWGALARPVHGRTMNRACCSTSLTPRIRRHPGAGRGPGSGRVRRRGTALGRSVRGALPSAEGRELDPGLRRGDGVSGIATSPADHPAARSCAPTRARRSEGPRPGARASGPPHRRRCAP